MNPSPFSGLFRGLAFGEEILSYQLLPIIMCCLQSRKALLEGILLLSPLPPYLVC